ncbi:unnamed protein product [Chrysoparadoxa australica]
MVRGCFRSCFALSIGASTKALEHRGAFLHCAAFPSRLSFAYLSAVQRLELSSALPSTTLAMSVGSTSQVQDTAVASLQLDRDSFSKRVKVVAIKVPAKMLSSVMRTMKGDLLTVPKTRNVRTLEGETDRKLVLLSPAATATDGLVSGISEAGCKFITDNALELAEEEVTTGYATMKADEVLRALIGPEIGRDDIGTSFETAGHIAHLNLRSRLLPYRYVIGQVILDKATQIRTVVNKTGEISSEFRTFPMEVVAGEDNMCVELNESGCRFKFNFAEVYWNSRLQMEHARLIDIICRAGKSPKETVVCDMMAGVGPFAVPLAKKGCRVLANDLNPRSHHYLLGNSALNKVQATLEAHNMCGRAFVKMLLERGEVFDHVIMNLPASAPEFLDSFSEVDWAKQGYATPPTIHCYCFSKAEDPAAEAIERINRVMGAALTAQDVRVHKVRSVAPKKPMMCLSFQAPQCAGASKRAKLTDEGEGAAEKAATEGQ